MVRRPWSMAVRIVTTMTPRLSSIVLKRIQETRLTSLGILVTAVAVAFKVAGRCRHGLSSVWPLFFGGVENGPK
jgi:hypothetical protein